MSNMVKPFHTTADVSRWLESELLTHKEMLDRACPANRPDLRQFMAGMEHVLVNLRVRTPAPRVARAADADFSTRCPWPEVIPHGDELEEWRMLVSAALDKAHPKHVRRRQWILQQIELYSRPLALDGTPAPVNGPYALLTFPDNPVYPNACDWQTQSDNTQKCAKCGAEVPF